MFLVTFKNLQISDVQVLVNGLVYIDMDNIGHCQTLKLSWPWMVSAGLGLSLVVFPSLCLTNTNIVCSS